MWSLYSYLGVVLLAMTSLKPMTSSATQHVAKVRIYVEQGAEDLWRKNTGNYRSSDFRRQMDSTFFEINEVYKSMKQNGVDLQLQIDDVKFLRRNILNTNNNQVNTDAALRSFRQYVQPGYSNNKYDITILYTSADLVGSSGSSTVGYASLSAVCSSQAVGVIELKTSYDDVLVTAHELGHVFGAHHDGDTGAYACNSRSGEIMNPSEDVTSAKHFFFSSCTASQIKKKIDELNSYNNNCLKDWSNSGFPKGPRMADIMTADDVCRRLFGSDSFVFNLAYKNYDDICVSLKCKDKWSSRSYGWKLAATPPGLKCGKNKICLQGKCVTNNDGSPDVSEKCPFGDMPRYENPVGSPSCSDMTYDKCQRYKKACCKTCADPGTPDEICQGLAGKSSALVRPFYKKDYSNICSKLACLRGYKGKSFQYATYSAPDGMLCGKSKVCSSGRCVSSKLGNPKMSETCPYGDMPKLGGGYQSTCASQTTSYGCSGVEDACCGSCTDPGTADEACQSLQGSYSKMARIAYQRGYGDDLCSKLACLNSKSGGGSYSWYTYKAPDGMKCGQNKRCQNGRCSYTKTGDPNMSNSCPYGDQPGQRCAGVDKGLNCRPGSGFQSLCCGYCSS